ncbi:MAG: 50S ribosomal protein L3 [Candidatus Staskawiczbacteria bacterium]|nr:50S ribosomal protein L3 [Candidatus Staskawiczbacteria bacterium]
MKFIIGKKIGMTQMFDSTGKITPVTLVEAGPCTILQKMSKDKEGYDALQLGYIKIEKKSKIKKSMKGKEYRYIKETRTTDTATVGDQVTVSIFAEGDKVTVVGTSKGKGFQGGVKRHGFHGRNATHGAKHEARTIGSIGQRFPQHVIKGRKMPGRMGFDRVTVKNLKVAKIDVENNMLALMGAIPGHKGTLLQIKG